MNHWGDDDQLGEFISADSFPDFPTQIYELTYAIERNSDDVNVKTSSLGFFKYCWHQFIYILNFV